jgi:inosine-uridine nucleoside N-ribohydrolase
VHGNASVRNTTRNARRVLRASGLAHIRVLPGASRPLVRRAFPYPDYIHGNSGLAGVDHLLNPNSDDDLIDDAGHAINAMADTIKENPGAWIVAIGPLTNIALLLTLYPSIPLGGCFF